MKKVSANNVPMYKYVQMFVFYFWINDVAKQIIFTELYNTQYLLHSINIDLYLMQHEIFCTSALTNSGDGSVQYYCNNIPCNIIK